MCGAPCEGGLVWFLVKWRLASCQSWLVTHPLLEHDTVLFVVNNMKYRVRIHQQESADSY